MNSVVMSIRGLPSLELWVPTLPVVPVSSGWNQMVPGGSGGSGGSGDSEIVGFDWSYQSWIRKWYFVMFSSEWGTWIPCRSRSGLWHGQRGGHIVKEI